VPKRRSAPAETRRKNVRHCSTCDRDVHYCKTPSELVAAIEMNYRMAVAIQMPKRKKPSVFVGDALPLRYHD